MPLVPTADLCDQHEAALASGALRVLPPLFRSFGGAVAFAGPAATVRAVEDNTSVRDALETPGEGRVLVVDGAGSLRCALVGGNLGALAATNGWAGIVVNGCVRDTAELAAGAVGVYALAAHPRKSHKRVAGPRDVPVDIAGVRVHPGEWIYVDGDGILVSAAPLG